MSEHEHNWQTEGRLIGTILGLKRLWTCRVSYCQAYEWTEPDERPEGGR